MKKTGDIIEAALDFERDWTALVEEPEPEVAKDDETPEFTQLVAGLLRGERLMAERRQNRG